MDMGSPHSYFLSIGVVFPTTYYILAIASYLLPTTYYPLVPSVDLSLWLVLILVLLTTVVSQLESKLDPTFDPKIVS